MTEVIDFESARKHKEESEEGTPHWGGPCVCLGCGHEWIGVGEIGSPSNLECPECTLPKGAAKYPFGSAPGDMTLVCTTCAGEALTAYIRNGRHKVICMGCGSDLTEAFFGG